MTAEYLNRSSLVARMKCYEKHTTEESGEHYAYSVALREIRNAPAADVAPVVHGWWKKVRKSRSTWECSVCGTKVGAFFAGCSQYCYCCGAQMGGITE
jgi:hypothetical protein